MTESSSRPGNNDDVMAQFFGDLERRGSAIIDDYKRRYPQLAPEFDDAVRMQDVLGDARPDSPLEVPARLGGFRIIGRLSRGGMGELYEAEQEPIGRRVVVKIIRRGRISPQTRDRFLREQEVLAKLHQTNIVPIYATGEEGRLQFYAMPYIDGAALNHVVQAVRDEKTAEPGSKTPTLVELAAKLARTGAEAAPAADPSAATTGPVTRAGEFATGRLMLSAEYFRSVAQALADVAEAVHHAHGAGILHRDLKPSNVMVDRSGHCWVIDFGLAGYLGKHGEGVRQVQAADGSDPAAASGVMGTPNYMAPEQFDSKADERSDVWALGATIYELLTLRRAFSGETFADVRTKVCEASPARIEELTANVPADLAAICRKAMRKEPHTRYQTAQEFADDLRRWLRHEPTQARGAWPVRRAALWARRNPGWAVAGMLAVVASVVVASLAVGAEQQQTNTAKLLASAERKRAEEAETGKRKSDREALKSELLRILMTAHMGGWRAQTEGLIRRMVDKAEPGDSELRDLAAVTLIGLDAEHRPGFKFAALSVGFDPDGKRLFMSEPDKGVHVSEVGTVNEPKLLTQPGNGGQFVFQKDGTALQLVIPNEDTSTLVLWDVLGQKTVQRFRFPGEEKRTASAYAATPDGVRVIGAAHQANGKGVVVAIWEGSTGKLVYSVAATATDVALAPDGSLLAYGDREGRITVRSLPKWEEVAVLRADTNEITTLAFGHDPLRRATPGGPGAGWLLAAGDEGSRVTVWDIAMRVPRCYCFGLENGVHKVAFSPDGVILAGTGRAFVKLWDIATGRLVLDLPAANWMTDLAFSPDGRRLAASSIPNFGPGLVKVWELHDGHGLRSYRGLGASVTNICLSPDGKLLAGLADDWHVAIWERASGRLRFVFEAPKGYSSDNAALAFNADGSRVAFAAGTAAILWDAATGQTVKEWKLPPGFADKLAFGAKGELVLARVETKDRNARPFGNNPKANPRVFRIRNLFGDKPVDEPIKEIEDFKWHVFHSALSPDGTLLVAEGASGPKFQGRAVNAYDGLTGAPLWSRPIPTKEDYSGLRLDPTGRLVMLATTESTMTVMDARTRKYVATVPRIFEALGPGATLKAVRQERPPFGVSIHRGDSQTPLVTLGLNVSAYRVQFDTDGRHMVWGNRDGTVTLANLTEVNRRLAEFKLDW
jgi:serine/threonine protein kinase/WD40 repeat protein